VRGAGSPSSSTSMDLRQASSCEELKVFTTDVSAETCALQTKKIKSLGGRGQARRQCRATAAASRARG
jgi:hypothetical protein